MKSAATPLRYYRVEAICIDRYGNRFNEHTYVTSFCDFNARLLAITRLHKMFPKYHKVLPKSAEAVGTKTG